MEKPAFNFPQRTLHKIPFYYCQCVIKGHFLTQKGSTKLQNKEHSFSLDYIFSLMTC